MALARLDRMTDREKYRTRGSYYLFARKPELAAQEFTALVKAYPADTSGLSNLALASFYQRDMAQALEQGRRAAAIFPNNVLRQSNVALYAMYAGQFEDAITASLEVHKLNPTHLKAFVARALSQLALGRFDEARATYEALGKTSAAGASFAAIGLADLAAAQGRFTDAARIWPRASLADDAAGFATPAAAKRVALAEVHLARGDICRRPPRGRGRGRHRRIRQSARRRRSRAGRGWRDRPGRTAGRHAGDASRSRPPGLRASRVRGTGARPARTHARPSTTPARRRNSPIPGRGASSSVASISA